MVNNDLLIFFMIIIGAGGVGFNFIVIECDECVSLGVRMR